MLPKQLLKLVVLISLFMPSIFAECYADAARKNLTIAILPCYDSIMTFKKFNRLIAYLKDRTGLDIDVVVPTDLETIRASIQSAEIDFILQDPHTYVQLADLLNKGSIISTLMRDGTSFQHGLIIARRDSGIKDIRDLRGKSFMFGPKLSISKWIAARELLEKDGIDIDKDLKAYSHGGCCEDIAFHVFLKAVDAGAVCDDFLGEKETELGIDLKQIIVIGTTGHFPTRVFAARNGVDSEIQARVNQALLSLDRKNPLHAEILGPTELGGFRVSRDQDYENIRALVGENPL